jgi:hypothetical protein
LRLVTNPLASSCDKCPLAVEAVIPASRASSFEVNDMPDISAMSILARAGSPIMAAIFVMSGPSFTVWW